MMDIYDLSNKIYDASAKADELKALCFALFCAAKEELAGDISSYYSLIAQVSSLADEVDLALETLKGV